MPVLICCYQTPESWVSSIAACAWADAYESWVSSIAGNAGRWVIFFWRLEESDG
jgi:hypothetical protein